nr:hypothetical protein [uncultured Blautia sp.]
MTREENLLYRRSCPYDAMGDYSLLIGKEEKRPEEPEIQQIRKKPGKEPIRQCR